ncbi:DUF1707 domain-containing protein [Streptomyces sp. NBC_00249]|uniref:DUF1707 SHOCT-like domain-containing protein n=1 Tax=Streptomyces sp. NBC_00249 TaxID=2975690 RepID=UPI00225B3BEE|nr:DUF1707 domain-containing protein [Streptomyces sp. NBC_00249]MCX5194655.1 DUF1707 domain-containing protein [Streptomyces sp. NBC_00249]
MDLEKHPAAPAAAAAPAPAELRASDADRDRIAQILSDALAEGRLTAEEHSERLDSLYALKTVGELDTLVRDLPAAPGAPAPSPAAQAPVGASAGPEETVVAVCSSSARRGRWRPGPRTRAVSVMGDITIDLTEAVFEQQVTEINVTCVLGNVEVLVPENVTLRGYGSGVLGNFEVRGEGGATDPQAPVVIVRGFALLGNIEARPKLGARLVDLALKLRKRLEG